MPARQLQRSLLEVLDRLDNQQIEVNLLQHNLEHLRFECIDLKCSLTLFDQTLVGLAHQADECADTLRDFPAAE